MLKSFTSIYLSSSKWTMVMVQGAILQVTKSISEAQHLHTLNQNKMYAFWSAHRVFFSWTLHVRFSFSSWCASRTWSLWSCLYVIIAATCPSQHPFWGLIWKRVWWHVHIHSTFAGVVHAMPHTEIRWRPILVLLPRFGRLQRYKIVSFVFKVVACSWCRVQPCFIASKLTFALTFACLPDFSADSSFSFLAWQRM